MNNKAHFEALQANIEDADILEMYLDAGTERQFLEQMRLHRDAFNKAISIVQGCDPRDNSMEIHRMLSDMGMFGAIWWSDADIVEEFNGSFEEELEAGEVRALTDEDIENIRYVLIARSEKGYSIDGEVLQNKVFEYVNANMRI